MPQSESELPNCLFSIKISLVWKRRTSEYNRSRAPRVVHRLFLFDFHLGQNDQIVFGWACSRYPSKSRDVCAPSKLSVTRARNDVADLWTRINTSASIWTDRHSLPPPPGGYPSLVRFLDDQQTLRFSYGSLSFEINQCDLLLRGYPPYPSPLPRGVVARFSWKIVRHIGHFFTEWCIQTTAKSLPVLVGHW